MDSFANPYRNDIRIKCPTTTEDDAESVLCVDLNGCGWWTRHGIPISPETYQKEMSERDHRLVDAVSTEWPEQQEPDSVEDRLQALGYLQN